MIIPNYYKVQVQFIQQQELLVAAKNKEEAEKLVRDNVTEGTEGFKVNNVLDLSEDEKKWVIANLTGAAGGPEADTAEPSGEVQDTRTLN